MMLKELVAMATVLGASPSYAAVKAYNFRGFLISSGLNFAPVGTEIKGSFVVDDDAPLRQFVPTSDYDVRETFAVRSLNFNGLGFELREFGLDFTGSGIATVMDGKHSYYDDEIRLFAEQNYGSLRWYGAPDHDLRSASLYLQGYSPYVLSSTQFPSRIRGHEFGQKLLTLNFAGYSARFNIASVGFASVPAPATWLSMLAGFGLLGAAMRLRRSEASPRFPGT